MRLQPRVCLIAMPPSLDMRRAWTDHYREEVIRSRVRQRPCRGHQWQFSRPGCSAGKSARPSRANDYPADEESQPMRGRRTRRAVAAAAHVCPRASAHGRQVEREGALGRLWRIGASKAGRASRRQPMPHGRYGGRRIVPWTAAAVAPGIVTSETFIRTPPGLRRPVIWRAPVWLVTPSEPRSFWKVNSLDQSGPSGYRFR